MDFFYSSIYSFKFLFKWSERFLLLLSTFLWNHAPGKDDNIRNTAVQHFKKRGQGVLDELPNVLEFFSAQVYVWPGKYPSTTRAFPPWTSSDVLKTRYLDVLSTFRTTSSHPCCFLPSCPRSRRAHKASFLHIEWALPVDLFFFFFLRNLRPKTM